MIRINLLQSISAFGYWVHSSLQVAVGGLVRKGEMPIRNLGRQISASLFLGALGALWGNLAFAQTHTIYLAPIILYEDGYFADLYSTSIAAVFAQSTADVAAINAGPNVTYSIMNNLAPDAQAQDSPFLNFNGIPYAHTYGIQQCDSGDCEPINPWGEIVATVRCPVGTDGGYSGQFGTVYEIVNNGSTRNEIFACPMTIPDFQPPPTNCHSCIGNPVYAATGQKLQADTDYSNGHGLAFTRTYRSNIGFAASVLTQAFVDNSQPTGTVSAACYPTQWNYSSFGGSLCVPYISVYPYVNNGVAQYQIQTDDGRSLGFSGPPSAVTANADINERVTQITFNGAIAWQVHRDDDTIEVYNAAGNLIQKTLRGGRALSYTYSTTSTPVTIAPKPGLLLTESDAFGHKLSWQYNAASQMIQMTDPAAGIYKYSYDASSNLTKVIYPDTSSKTYWYNESANTSGTNLPTALTGITDESSVRYAAFQYNSSGLAVNTQHAGGVNSYTFTYPNPGISAGVTDPLGTTRSYSFGQQLSYDLDTGQTQPTASGGSTVTQAETYDGNGNPASVTDFNGNVTTSVYDLTRNLETSRTEAYGTAQARTITTSLDPNWRQPDLITEPNRTTRFTYDGLGNVLTKTITDLTVTPNATRTWTYTYDSYGRMLTAHEPRTDVNSTKTYQYYTCTTGSKCGEIETITDALSHVWTFNTYNAQGQPLTITDPNGVVTTLTYDSRLRLLSRKIGSETTSYSYYATGLLKLVTQPDGSTILYTYDGAHRLTMITDGLGNYVMCTLDNMGNCTAENSYDPSGSLRRAHTRTFNALNRLYQDINAAGTTAVTTTLGYDNNGNLTSSDAPLSRNTANQYDSLNRLTQITDPNSGLTKLAYDANDNLTSVVDPRALTTSYTHNGFNDVTKLVSPDTGTSTQTYDSGGNLKTTTDARSAEASYSYDALNRVTQIVYADQTINLTYDAGTNGKGRLTGASDASHAMSWSYDTHGRVTGKGQTVATITKSVGYAYTNADVTSMVTPSGQTVVYGYTNHRVTSIAINGTTLLSGVTYDPFGPATAWTWGNSSTVSRSFDEDGSSSSVTTAGVTNRYTVDNASRITGISDSGLSTNTWTFGYDVLDRVTSGLSSSRNRGYTYDANGNQLTSTGTVVTTEHISTTNNRIASTTGAIVRTYAYDASGNTQSYTGASFTFNQRGRMSSATAGSTTANYVYSATGALIEKTVGSVTTLLMYDESGHIVGEYSNTGALIQETVWMDNIPVATIRHNGSTGCTSTVCVFYVHTNHLGAPVKVTRPSDNKLAWRWDPDTFGSSTATPNQNPSGLGTFIYNLRFPGQYYQAETGLFYNYFRTFDPQMGKYLESDPIGLDGGGYSTYAYANGNPISNTDPLGLYLRIVGSTPTNQAALEGALATLEQTFRGGGLVQMAENSPYMYVLTDLYNDQYQAAYYDFIAPFLININPDFHPLIHVATPCGQEAAPTAIILAHELGHVAGTYDVGPGKMDNVIQNENPVRQELGYPLRTAYPLVRDSEARNCGCSR
jgi:RHS repeat-associated protein